MTEYSAAGLSPTPTRLALLAQIRAGRVWEDWSTDEPGTVVLMEYPGRETRVTGQVRVMRLAGWVQTEPDDDDLHSRRISLTDAGRVVLRVGTGREG